MRAFKEAADKLESLDALPQDKNANRELVLKQFAITQEQIAISLEYARFLYEYGLYSESARVSGLAIRLVEDPQKLLNFLWGKLAAQIMNGDFSKAATTVISLKDMIESRSSIPATLALQHRSWLLHWSLFVFFDPQCTSGVDGLIDLYLNPTFTNALQTASPYLLRYLCIAILVSARRETLIKDLVKLVQSELYQYRDPFTDFVYALQSECDFAQASSKFVEAKKVSCISGCMFGCLLVAFRTRRFHFPSTASVCGKRTFLAIQDALSSLQQDRAQYAGGYAQLC